MAKTLFSDEGGLLERPSTPLCLAAGTCTSLKENRSIPAIHRLMVALGCVSGLLIIPLIYFASTSTVRFDIPKMNTRIARRARKSPYSSSFACEYRLSTSLSAIELKRHG